MYRCRPSAGPGPGLRLPPWSAAAAAPDHGRLLAAARSRACRAPEGRQGVAQGSHRVALRHKLHADVAGEAGVCDGPVDGRVVELLRGVRLVPPRVAGDVVVGEMRVLGGDGAD